MYFQEIKQSLDAGDFRQATLWMYRRTAWIQHTELSAAERQTAAEETAALKALFLEKCNRLHDRISTMKRVEPYIKAYRQGRGASL